MTIQKMPCHFCPRFIRDAITAIAITINDPSLSYRIQKARFEQRAFLFLEGRNFAVLKPVFRDGIKTVLVWVAYAEGGADNRTRYTAFFEQAAREINAEKIEFWSVRKGLFKILPAFGYQNRPETLNDLPITVWEKTL